MTHPAQTPHTPTPWKSHPERYYEGRKRSVIYGDHDKDGWTLIGEIHYSGDANFIVEAVNFYTSPELEELRRKAAAWDAAQKARGY